MNNLNNSEVEYTQFDDSFHGSTIAVPMRERVRECLEEYFDHLDGHAPTALYDMVLQEVEAPLLEVVMRHTGWNQSRAAAVLGINRNTLRKKLQYYDLDRRGNG